MSWGKLALKNSWRNSRQYFGYLLSSSLAVAVFFMFQIFIHHPQVDGGTMPGAARTILLTSGWVVTLFAIFFILFFHSAMIRTRKKEFGLFLTLGMHRNQLGFLVFAESLLLGAFAIFIGFGIGLLFSKLFLLAMSAILHLQAAIPLVISVEALKFTFITFGGIFVIDGIGIAISVFGYTPKNLLIGSRTKQKAYKISVLRMLLGLICLGVGYYLAIGTGTGVIFLSLPIILFVIVGTYLLYSQFVAILMRHLRKRSLKGIPMLIVSRIAHRIKDLTRTLTVVTILTAVVLTGMGVVYSAMYVFDLTSVRTNPFSLQIAIQDGENATFEEEIKKEIARNDFTITQEVQAKLLSGTVKTAERDSNLWILSTSSFEEMVTTIAATHPQLEDYLVLDERVVSGEGRLYTPPPMITPSTLPTQQVKLQVGKLQYDYLMESHNAVTRVLNATDFGHLPMFVVSDEDFLLLWNDAPSQAKWSFSGFMLADWENSAELIDRVKEKYDAAILNGSLLLSDTITTDRDVNQFFSLTLFAGMFISLLFVLASGSTIYFKLFTQVDEDQRQFRSLSKIGFTKNEAKQVLRVELSILFFAPFLLAFLHSLFAMLSFSNLIQYGIIEGANFWPTFYTVAGVTLLCYLIYYLFARKRYIQQVWF